MRVLSSTHTRARAREYTLRQHKGIILKRPKQKTLDTNPTRGKPNQSNYQLNPIKYYFLYICNCFQLFVYGQSTRTGGAGRGGWIAGMRRFNEYANASMRHCRCGNVCEICKWGDFMRLNRAAELIAKFNLKIKKSPVQRRARVSNMQIRQFFPCDFVSFRMEFSSWHWGKNWLINHQLLNSFRLARFRSVRFRMSTIGIKSIWFNWIDLFILFERSNGPVKMTFLKQRSFGSCTVSGLVIAIWNQLIDNQNQNSSQFESSHLHNCLIPDWFDVFFSRNWGHVD